MKLVIQLPEESLEKYKIRRAEILLEKIRVLAEKICHQKHNYIGQPFQMRCKTEERKDGNTIVGICQYIGDCEPHFLNTKIKYKDEASMEAAVEVMAEHLEKNKKKRERRRAKNNGNGVKQKYTSKVLALPNN